MDVSYFFGYATTQYVNIPFILKEYSVLKFELENGDFQIEAELPPYLHTHCKKQSYRFDSEGLLIRNDYTADIVGILGKRRTLYDSFSRYRRISDAYKTRRICSFGVLGDFDSCFIRRIEAFRGLF
ncbi:hypothetical protein LEP1GSC088_1838 [Leptospira interrogans str. L1207]|nr:hypothetical protein LEP1GSC088_1838 [Leptospira interrogans str. L1207]